MNYLTAKVILITTVIAYVRAQDCAPYSAFKDHTMCIYKENTCTGFTVIDQGMKPEAKKEVVAIHNKLRQSLMKGQVKGQPKAKNMLTMEYDEELGKVAQRAADQCKFQHDKMRNVARFSVGQNIYKTSRSSIDPNKSANMTTATMAWWNEVYKPGFSPKKISPFVFDSKAGHYTQIAWANTKTIGCGYVMYSDSTGWSHKLIFCNYGPGGNVIGATMYVKA